MSSYPSWFTFLKAYLRSPRSVGAWVETGRPASRALVEGANVTTAKSLVLEIGAGTGSVTREIVAALPSGAVLLCVERDQALADSLRSSFSLQAHGVHVVTGDAIHSRRFLQERGLPPAESVIAAIPWTMLSSAKQDEMLDAVSGAMAPGASFSCICYLGGALLPGFWLLRRKLRQRFGEVSVEGPVWKNAPPAFILTARKR